MRGAANNRRMVYWACAVSLATYYVIAVWNWWDTRDGCDFALVLGFFQVVPLGVACGLARSFNKPGLGSMVVIALGVLVSSCVTIRLEFNAIGLYFAEQQHALRGAKSCGPPALLLYVWMMWAWFGIQTILLLLCGVIALVVDLSVYKVGCD